MEMVVEAMRAWILVGVVVEPMRVWVILTRVFLIFLVDVEVEPMREVLGVVLLHLQLLNGLTIFKFRTIRTKQSLKQY